MQPISLFFWTRQLVLLYLQNRDECPISLLRNGSQPPSRTSKVLLNVYLLVKRLFWAACLFSRNLNEYNLLYRSIIIACHRDSEGNDLITLNILCRDYLIVKDIFLSWRNGMISVLVVWELVYFILIEHSVCARKKQDLIRTLRKANAAGHFSVTIGHIFTTTRCL